MFHRRCRRRGRRSGGPQRSIHRHAGLIFTGKSIFIYFLSRLHTFSFVIFQRFNVIDRTLAVTRRLDLASTAIDFEP